MSSRTLPRIRDLAHLTADWPVNRASVGATRISGTTALGGQPDWTAPVASITKLFTAYAVLVAHEERSLDLDDPAGPAGSTVRHLLAHASGLNFDDGTLVARPGSRRIYSNTGIEVLAEFVADATGMAFADYLTAAVVEPLGLTDTRLEGSPAAGAVSSVNDLLTFARELMHPTLVHRDTMAEAVTSQFPRLSGVLPGFGRQAPNSWGLGFEIRMDKSPHWTATQNSPGTFGHFGGSGSFLWVDPAIDVACCCITDRSFGPWAATAWPRFSDQVLDPTR